MAPGNDAQLSPLARMLVALAAIAAGVFPILAAFDVGGPFRHEDINGPPWIAGAAGAAFVMAGIAVAAGDRERMRWLGGVAGFLVFLALVAIGHWIAFGAGERECTSTVSGFFGSRSREAGNLECRLAFGMGALMLDGILLWGLGALLGKQFGPATISRAIERIGKGLFLFAIAPILLLLFAATAGKALVASFREYRQTGRWPRNEAFIARLEARREAERGATPAAKPDVERDAKGRGSGQSTNSSAGHSR
jgi:hypothetical protein